jgi:TatD DNase family protein
MLIDTHCHINMMVKKTFDTELIPDDLLLASSIVDEAYARGVTCIINVGTSLVESFNCIQLARQYAPIHAAVGIHPNDCTQTWHNDFLKIKSFVNEHKKNKIVGIGETGLDRHYPDTNIDRQKDAFRAHIDLALEENLGLIVHTRDARDETLRALEEYKGQISRGIIHCFSEDQDFADQVIAMGFAIGLGGIITYPKNEYLRQIARTVPLDKIVLETDAPFLPPQEMRGKQNSPAQIRTIAEYLAQLRGISLQEVAQQTSKTAMRIFEVEV